MLDQVTRCLAAPEIPFDCRYRRNSIVYYRYGAYRGGVKGERLFLIDSSGRQHADICAPRSAVPPWVEDPFRCRPRLRTRKARGPIGLAYLVSKAVVQRGKGGVFEALDLSVYPARWIILKQGRRNGDTDWSGEDGASRVKRESRILLRLKAAGIEVPEVFRTFMQSGNQYLVLEKLRGRPLLPRRKQQPSRTSWRGAQRVLNTAGVLLSKLHAAGWVWRDCKPDHIFRHRGKLTLIDFEGACRIEETDRMPWGSPNYVPPIYHGKFSRRPGTLEDDYALGVIAFQFMVGEFPPRTWQSRRPFYQRAGCPNALQSRIEDLLRY
ncbi:MAG: lipopolysaccharide kinase InaA family protein [Gemmatimonadales bacterium]